MIEPGRIRHQTVDGPIPVLDAQRFARFDRGYLQGVSIDERVEGVPLLHHFETLLDPLVLRLGQRSRW